MDDDYAGAAVGLLALIGAIFTVLFGVIWAIATERATIHTKLPTMDTNMESGRQSVYHALDYLSDPQVLYHTLSTTGRKLLTTMIFARLFVDTDNHRVHVAADQLHEPFHAPVTTHRRHQRYWRCTTTQPTQTPQDEPAGPLHTVNRGAPNNQDAPDWDLLTSTDLLTLGLLDQGSNKAAMVARGGVTPPTFQFSGLGTTVRVRTAAGAAGRCDRHRVRSVGGGGGLRLAASSPVGRVPDRGGDSVVVHS